MLHNTRQCIEGGQWTGPPPSCNPILCQNPPAVVNGVVELVNGTTLWQVICQNWNSRFFYNSDEAYENFHPISLAECIVYVSCSWFVANILTLIIWTKMVLVFYPWCEPECVSNVSCNIVGTRDLSLDLYLYPLVWISLTRNSHQLATLQLLPVQDCLFNHLKSTH